MSGDLAGSTAVVTGATSGIGFGIVERLVRDGARVFLAGLDKQGLDEAVGRLDPDVAGAVAGGFAGSLDEVGVAEELVAQAISGLGHVDILVNNAGGGVIRPTLEQTEETLQSTINNNLWTTIRCTLAVLPHMVSRQYGRVINIGAESVRNGLIDHAVYNAAKGGVHAIATGLAREFATAGITFNTVAPSYVLTPELVTTFESDVAPVGLVRVVEEAVRLIPVGRPGTCAEVASAVSFLARAESGFITGQTIYVNGGSSMG